MSEYGTEILIFAGTTEGRELAERLADAGVRCTVSVATEYGTQVLGTANGRTVLQGRMTQEQMEFLIREESFTCVVDATHPFATEVSEQIRKACEATGVEYLRLARDTERDMAEDAPAGGFGIYEAATMQEAAGILRNIPGNLFLTTGSKDLPLLTQEIGDPERLYVRVLPSVESLKICMECGIPVNHFVAMQGPFTQEMNVATLRQIEAGAVLTKETGKVGGFDAKLAAAKEVGIPIVVVRNPERESKNTDRLTFDQILERLAKITGVRTVAREGQSAGKRCAGDEAQSDAEADLSGREYVMAGLSEREYVMAGLSEREYVMAAAGPGDAGYLTDEVRTAVERADVVFGAQSIIEKARKTGLLDSNKLCVPIYKAEQILPYMEEHPQLRRAAVLFSGDTGLYSGALQLREALEAEKEPVRVRCLPGISSVTALAAALQVTWEDAVILSTHGRERNVVGHLRRERKVFLLVAGLSGVHSTANLLREAVANDILPGSMRIGYGYNLPEESGFVSLEQLERMEKRGSYILYLENPAADDCPMVPGMEDAEFERAEVPMTKEEVRVLALSRLRLTGKAVLYDIGAGTGSVSVEAARLCPDCKIWAIEKKPEAVQLLRTNLSKYCLPNVTVIEAAAPECMEDLPAPTHVFIGGSGSAMPEILRTVLRKNPRVRIVLTCVTLETLTQTLQVAKELPVTEPQIRQIAVTRAQKAGSYHMMKAQNPIYIIDFEGNGA